VAASQLRLTLVLLGLDRWHRLDLDHFGIGLPFMSFSIEWSSDGAWQWAWSFARLTIWRTKFRLDLDLNIWFLGVNLGNWRDFGIYLGPFNIQIETGRLR
jgi:hypothetical protein